METLKGCFSCMDWNIFHRLDLNEATETITDNINFCVDTIVPKKYILYFPNNKPHITRDIKTTINRKRLAFKNNDRVGAAAAQREPNIRLRKAKS